MSENLIDATLNNKEDSPELRNEILSGASRFDFLTGLPGMTYYFSLEDIGRKQNLEAGHHLHISAG